jgi:hypothetical protein
MLNCPEVESPPEDAPGYPLTFSAPKMKVCRYACEDIVNVYLSRKSKRRRSHVPIIPAASARLPTLPEVSFGGRLKA